MPGGAIDIGHYEVDRNGEKIRYTIQSVTPDLLDEAVTHMKTYFLRREPMCAHTGFIDDPVSVKSIDRFWREAVQAGTTIGAYELNKDGSRGKLIGANMTAISNKKIDKKEENKEDLGGPFNILLTAVVEQADASNIFELYGIDSYLTAYGLSVDPGYHGCNLGQNILLGREKICKHFGLRVTGTVFTASASQYLASKIGFKTLLEWDYKTVEVNGKKPFYDMWEKKKEKKTVMMAYEYS